MFSLWYSLAFTIVGICSAVLEIKSFNCDVAEESRVSNTSTFSLDVICATGANLSLSLNHKIVRNISEQEIILVLSSLSPLLELEQIDGVDPFITVIGRQTIERTENDIEESPVVDFGPLFPHVTFPTECGKYFLIAVLKIVGSRGQTSSSGYAVVDRECGDEAGLDLQLNLETTTANESPSVKRDESGRLVPNGLMIKLSRGDTASGGTMAPRTLMDAPTVAPSVWSLRKDNTMVGVQPRQGDENLDSLYHDRTDEVPLRGLELSGVSENKSIVLGIGESKVIDISVLMVPHLVCNEDQSYHILRLLLDPGLRIPDTNRTNNVINLPLHNCTSMNLKTEKKRCEVIPGAAGNAVLKYGTKAFFYDGEMKGFQNLSQDDPKLLKYFIHDVEVRDKAARLASIGQCPNPPLDDDPKQALKDSLVGRARGFVTALLQQFKNITTQDEVTKEDKMTLVSLFSLADVIISAYVVPKNVEFRQFLLQLVSSKSRSSSMLDTQRENRQEVNRTEDEMHIVFPDVNQTTMYEEEWEKECEGSASSCLIQEWVSNAVIDCRDGTHKDFWKTREKRSANMDNVDISKTPKPSLDTKNEDIEASGWKTEALLSASRKNPNNVINNNKNVDTSTQITNDNRENHNSQGASEIPATTSGQTGDSIPAASSAAAATASSRSRPDSSLSSENEQDSESDPIAEKYSDFGLKPVPDPDDAKPPLNHPENPQTHHQDRESDFGSSKKKPSEYHHTLNTNGRWKGEAGRHHEGAESAIQEVVKKLLMRLATSSSPAEMPEFDFIPSPVLRALMDLIQQDDNMNESALESSYVELLLGIAKHMKWMSPGSLNGTQQKMDRFLECVNETVVLNLINSLEGDSDMEARVDFLLQVLDVISYNLEKIILFAKQGMKIVFDQREMELLKHQHGKELPASSTCRRAACQNLHATKMSEMTPQTAESSPFVDFKAILKRHESKKPFTWMEYKGGIYKVQRSDTFGEQFYEKVAACDCSNNSREGYSGNHTTEEPNVMQGLHSGDSKAHSIKSEKENETAAGTDQIPSARSFDNSNDWQGFGLPFIPGDVPSVSSQPDPETESSSDHEQYDGFGLEPVDDAQEEEDDDDTKGSREIHFPKFTKSILDLFGVKIEERVNP